MSERRKVKLQHRHSSLDRQQRPLHSAASREQNLATATTQAIPRTSSLSGANEPMRRVTIDGNHESPAISNWGVRAAPSTSSAVDPVDENHHVSSPGSLLQEDQVHLMRQASIPTDVSCNDSYKMRSLTKIFGGTTVVCLTASERRHAEAERNENRSRRVFLTSPRSGPCLTRDLLCPYLQCFTPLLEAKTLLGICGRPCPTVPSQGDLWHRCLVWDSAPLPLINESNARFRFLAPDHDARNLESMEFSELTALRVFHKRSLSWAKAASSEAMALAIPDPSLSVVQALEVLSPYWYGTGMPRCGDLSLGKSVPEEHSLPLYLYVVFLSDLPPALAYRCCVIMQYGGKRDGSAENDLSLEAELKRRCFWACWASMCIVASPEPYMRYSWSEIARVPLPATISHTPTGPQIKLTEYMDSNWVASRIYGVHDTEEPPVSAAMMKMVGVW